MRCAEDCKVSPLRPTEGLKGLKRLPESENEVITRIAVMMLNQYAKICTTLTF